jgi:GH15 family glucan-1,4-alpha-glucosidase
VQHPIGAHALLADGRTAALVTPDGDIAWLCWPRVDSPPCLLGILDDRRGGGFSVRPTASPAQVVSRAYVDDSLVLRTVWETPGSRLRVDDALAWDGPPRLIRRLRGEGRPVAVSVRFQPALGAATVTATMSVSGDRCLVTGAGIQLAVRAPGEWRITAEGAQAELTVPPGEERTVLLSAADDAGAAAASLDATLRDWRGLVAGVPVDLDPGGVAARALGVETAARLLRRSAAVLTGLHQRGGGIVAAPTTSLPQWPQTSRTWDYRYAWLRDSALAALALLRLDMVGAAATLGAFCGDACASGAPPPLLRVDGSAPPEERRLEHLSGWRGARPVRIGNAAAEMAQLDVAGEVIDLAAALATHDALPASLGRSVPVLAELLASSWAEPDHGIWEIRGRRRRYTHSRLMAWCGLRRAVTLARRGQVRGDADRWQQAAAAIRSAILTTGREHGTLPLHEAGGGPDAALSLVPLVGFLPTGHGLLEATLEGIDGLRRGGLCDRYLGQNDGIADPCGPFVFPTFWLAAARERSGGDGAAVLAAGAAARSQLDLFGEVADPVTLEPLGNFPQVQSHAAFILAAVPLQRRA